MHDTYEQGSLAADKNPVFIAITLITPGTPGFVGVVGFGAGFGPGFGVGFGVGEIGRLLSAGFALTTEFMLEGGVWISTTISPAVFPPAGFGAGPFPIGRCAGACLA